jgi:hypothetical protein
VQAYHAAGAPAPADGNPVGMYEAWTRCVVDPLRWLGMDDPSAQDVGATAERDDADPITPYVAELLLATHEAYGDQLWTTAWMMEDAFGDTAPASARRVRVPRAVIGGETATADQREDAMARLRDAISELKPYIDHTRRGGAGKENLRHALGLLFGHRVGRVLAGCRLVKHRDGGVTHNFYRVELVSPTGQTS